MFGRVRALIARGHEVANHADATLQIAKALLQDLQDGVAIKVHIDDHAAHKIISHFLKGHGGELPFTVSIDPTFDTLPPRIARFVGGEYDGREYVVDQSKRELVLQGGHRYVWDGHVFRHVAPAV